MKEKEQIRATIRGRRRALLGNWIEEHSPRVAGHVFAMHEFRNADSIACYLSAAKEVRTGDIATACWKNEMRVCVPAYRRESAMYRLCWFDEGARMEEGPMGICQPVDPAWVEDSDLDIMLVPGVAFDPRGGRVGHGGGHYDRLMAGDDCRRAFKVGLAFDFQVLPEVPLENHDIRMDAVVTETRVMRQGGIECHHQLSE